MNSKFIYQLKVKQMEKIGKRQFNNLLKNSSIVVCDGIVILNDGNNRLEIRYSVHNNKLSIYGLCNFNNNLASIGCDNTDKLFPVVKNMLILKGEIKCY